MGLAMVACSGCAVVPRWDVTFRTAVLFLATWIAPQVIAQIPHGVFSLNGSGQGASETVLKNPDVMGISIRQGGMDLEPTEGNFDWSFLDSEVAKAAAAGKKVMLRI